MSTADDEISGYDHEPPCCPGKGDDCACSCHAWAGPPAPIHSRTGDTE